MRFTSHENLLIHLLILPVSPQTWQTIVLFHCTRTSLYFVLCYYQHLVVGLYLNLLMNRCVAKGGCLLLLRHGIVGIGELTSIRSDMQCSALAATALPALVTARGHRIAKVWEIPLVVDDSIQSITKAKETIKVIKSLNVSTDIDRSKRSTKIHPGKGKMRQCRYVQKKGQLIIFNKDSGIKRAFRNLPGVELLTVNKLNVLMLAPGGHMGQFCVWSKSAFEKLDRIYGTEMRKSRVKRNYRFELCMD